MYVFFCSAYNFQMGCTRSLVVRNAEDQALTVDEASVFQPPSQLQMPLDDIPASASDSAVSAPDSDDNSSDNSDLPSPGPRYADEDAAGNRISQIHPVMESGKNLVFSPFDSYRFEKIRFIKKLPFSIISI